jgi:hypothetical protein
MIFTDSMASVLRSIAKDVVRMMRFPLSDAWSVLEEQ